MNWRMIWRSVNPMLSCGGSLSVFASPIARRRVWPICRRTERPSDRLHHDTSTTLITRGNTHPGIQPLSATSTTTPLPYTSSDRETLCVSACGLAREWLSRLATYSRRCGSCARASRARLSSFKVYYVFLRRTAKARRRV